MNFTAHENKIVTKDLLHEFGYIHCCILTSAVYGVQITKSLFSQLFVLSQREACSNQFAGNVSIQPESAGLPPAPTPTRPNDEHRESYQGKKNYGD